MPVPASAARRYAEAAFQIAERDDSVDQWVEELDAAIAALEDDELRALTQRLEQMTGAQVRLETGVDPGIIGGLVVRLGDRLIDGSVRGRLERLRTRLASGTL